MARASARQAPTPRRPATALGRPTVERLAGLDGLRAIAAGAIFVHHVGFWSKATFNSSIGAMLARLDVGVPVFFALSGFLMFRPVAVSILDGGALRPALDHLWRRALRVYPAFWVALGLIVLLTSESFTNGAMAVTTAALVQIHHPDLVRGPIPQAWSLATEISFYALLPVLARVLKPVIQSRPSRIDRITALLGLMAGLYLVSVFFRLYLYGLANSWTPAALLWLPAMIDHFAIGMALAVAHVGLRRGTPARARLDRLARPAGLWWLAAAALFLVVSEGLGLARGMESATWPREMMRHALYGAIGFTLLFPLVFGVGTGAGGVAAGRGSVRRLASGRVLTALGRISYSVYLWHMVFIVHLWRPAERCVEWFWDVTVRAGWFDAAFGWSGLVDPLDSRFATLAVAAGLPTLAVSTVSYWLVERPGQQAAACVRRPAKQPTALESAAGRLAEWWRTASWRAKLGVIAGLGAVVRFVYVLAAKRTETLDPDSVFPGDQFYYSLAGDALADGQGFVVPWHSTAIELQLVDPTAVARLGAAAPPAADHPPLTAIVAALGGLLPGAPGTHVLEQRLTMAALGVAGVVMVGLLARAVAGRRAGLIAAAVAAAHAGFWVNDGLVMSETLTVLTVAGALWAAVCARRSPSLGRAAAVGAWVGAAALTRAESLLLIPLLVLPAIWFARCGTRDRLIQMGAATGVTVLLVAPWVIPNLVRFNEPVLMSTNVGLTLAGANNPQAYSGGAIGFWTLEHVEDTIDVTGLDQSEASSVYTEQALDYALDHPERWPPVIAARIGRLWGLYQPLQMVDWNTGEGREIWASLLALASYAVLVPVAVGGWWVLRRSGRGAEAWILTVPVVYVTAVAAAFYGIARLRVPAEISVVVLAAVALAALGRPRDDSMTSSTSEAPAAAAAAPAASAGPAGTRVAAGK